MFQHTIDEVENLIKKHESFEKSATAQEERFGALERLTTVSSYFPYISPLLHFQIKFCTIVRIAMHLQNQPKYVSSLFIIDDDEL
jgi:hypothetical protein